MATKYRSIVPGKDFKVLDSKCVELAKALAGKIPQHGMRYIDGTDMVVLQSDNLFDILQTVKNGRWAHTSRPTRVKPGWEVLIVPSTPLQREYGVAAIGVSFIATEVPYVDQSEANELTWASEELA